MKIYIAGPMRGYPNNNFPAFDEAQKLWVSHGHEVVSPASIDRAFGHNGSDETLITPDFIRRAIAVDCQVIFFCDAIALLPGWWHSSGSTVELSLAQFLKLPIFDALTMKEVFPPKTPWSFIPNHHHQPGPPISSQ